MIGSWCKRLMAVPLLLLSLTGGAAAQGNGMSFFVTSIGLGNGADLGGLAGADKHCQNLATAAGAGSRTWRAYLSVEQGANGSVSAVNARDRIGTGPWYNAKGEMIAKDVTQLHAENNLTKETALSERGEVINGYGDSPNRHDILTGSMVDGQPYGGGRAFTCSGWTRSDDDPPAVAIVGHHDGIGHEGSKTARSERRRENPRSWTFAHLSRGCSQEALRSSGGDGLFYCFAAD